jgi:hypothetical protein
VDELLTCTTIAAMALPLLGERYAWLVQAGVAALVGLSAMSCAGGARTRRLPASVFQAARQVATTDEARARAQVATHKPGSAHGDAAAGFVERALHEAGLRFGTDGTTPALWGYLRTSQEMVAPADARPGDVVLFDTRGTGPDPVCADHAGIVERVDPDGRIGFVEERDGTVRHSFVDAARPTLRRDERGLIRNSFLRAKRITDGADAHYFAGEMLCAVARVTHR